MMKKTEVINHKLKLLLIIICLNGSSLFAQEKLSVQLKAFDQSMTPFPSIAVSVNGKDFVPLNQKGIGFTELTDNDLPIKNIRIKNEQLEAASWNYGKGTLEIMIRKKNYQTMPVIVKDEKSEPIPSLRITFNGKTSISLTTDNEGRLSVPLPIGEVIYSASQFSAQGYAMIKFISSGGSNQLTVSRLQPQKKEEPITKKKEEPVVNKPATKAIPKEKEYVSPSQASLPPIDTIRSITSLFAVLKNYDYKKLSRSEQQRIDRKFAFLKTEMEDEREIQSSSPDQPIYISRISDSTFFGSDMKNIVHQTKNENQKSETQSVAFDKKLRTINVKLANGIVRLDDRAKQDVLHELSSYENLLIERENRFLKSQRDSRLLINNVKSRFFERDALPERLTASEKERKAQEDSQDQLLMIAIGAAILFILIIIVFIFFIYALRRKNKALEQANYENKRISDSVEQIVLKRTRQLQLENKELDSFLYRASHDLRTPVRSILGLCNLADKMKGGEREEIVDRIIDTSEGMDEFLKKLSIVTEINQPSTFTPVTLLKIVDKVRHSFQRFIQEKRIDFVVRCNEYLVFYTYPHLAEAILYNIIENALYFSTLKKNSSPRVELIAEIKDMAVVIRVRDNGIGIQDSVKDKLFDMFFKGSEQSKGNGLGLYVVQKALAVLDGKIMIESVYGQFTEFSIVLPLKTKTEVRKEQQLHTEMV